LGYPAEGILGSVAGAVKGEETGKWTDEGGNSELNRRRFFIIMESESILSIGYSEALGARRASEGLILLRCDHAALIRGICEWGRESGREDRGAEYCRHSVSFWGGEIIFVLRGGGAGAGRGRFQIPFAV